MIKMKHEIEIPDFPEGWEAVSFRVPEEGEYYLGSGGIKLAQTDFHYRWLIVRKKQPRRIVLEESDIDNYDIVYRKNVGTTTYWKILEDNKCAE